MLKLSIYIIYIVKNQKLCEGKKYTENFKNILLYFVEMKNFKILSLNYFISFYVLLFSFLLCDTTHKSEWRFSPLCHVHSILGV
jgi:hypothetical protein